MNAQAAAYLVGALICGLLVIVIALAALLMAWREVGQQKKEIKRLKEENAKLSNWCREKTMLLHSYWEEIRRLWKGDPK